MSVPVFPGGSTLRKNAAATQKLNAADIAEPGSPLTRNYFVDFIFRKVIWRIGAVWANPWRRFTPLDRSRPTQTKEIFT